MSSEGVTDGCLAWAAGDPSGVLSPYKFSRRYALRFPLKVEFRFLYAMFYRRLQFTMFSQGFYMQCLYLKVSKNNNNQIHELFDAVSFNPE